MYQRESIVISDKIYRSSKLKRDAFFVSLLFHAIVFFALYSLFMTYKTKVEPNEPVYVRIPLSLEQITEKKPQVKVEHKASAEMKKESSVLKKEKTKVKASVKKVQKKTLQQIQPTLVSQKVVSAEAFTPQASKEELTTTINNDHSPLNSITEPLQPSPKEQLASSSKASIDPTTLGEIRKMIQEALRYPALAKRMQIEGVVVVSFVLSCDGRVESAKIVQESGSSSLDNKAMETLLSLSGSYPQIQTQMDLQIPIAFSLNKS
ncbi:MAG: energy transducer TonB [Sulfurimonas sp.]|nr:energy transducer TonB [Sulfurimonas sp.]